MVVKSIEKYLQNVPSSLHNLPIYVLWKRIDKNGHTSKVPYSVTGRYASADKPSTWASFADVMNVFNRGGYDGIGISMSHDIGAIDLDACITNEKVSTVARDIVNTMDTYTELSPSGKGLHILFTAPRFVYDTSRYYMKHSGIEIYISGCTNRFITLTGRAIANKPLADRSAEVLRVMNAYMQRSISSTHALDSVLPRVSVLTDAQVIHKAGTASNSARFAALWMGDMDDYPSQSEADLALCNILAFYCCGNIEQMDRLFRMSGLYREKWERADYRLLTLELAVKGCSCFYGGGR